MYRNDEFIDLGTLDYLAKKYNKKKSSLKTLTMPSAHKQKRRTLLYRIEEENAD